MKISTPAFRAHPPESAAPRVAEKPQSAGSFESYFAEAQVTPAKVNASRAWRVGQPDFANIAKAEYVAWGKSKFEQGEITLDDLFQIQFAGGDFDGSVSSDTGKHDFVAFFNALIENEIKARRASDPQSMIPAYRHVLASMSRDV
ncbi:hypothetical protein IY145_03080 [Methylosinus sp. H3A]|uniref:hypothetical protein n=1 Tax=Methylosinus sp. H3A TaxID=2785786 RepID=UPI0018C32676|nr:hypothetical protein [Methylosinus sp. H3A]MBG0808357.1 hypothetical protein [Methylosinus sp. H3A]